MATGWQSSASGGSNESASTLTSQCWRALRWRLIERERLRPQRHGVPWLGSPVRTVFAAMTRSIGVGLVAMGFAASAHAQLSRSPTVSERAAITAVLAPFVRGVPVACRRLDIYVWRRYALVGTTYPKTLPSLCQRYRFEFAWILKRTTRWRVVYSGTKPPPCSLGIPRAIAVNCWP